MKNHKVKIIIGLFLFIALIFALWCGFNTEKSAEPENLGQTEASVLSEPTAEQPPMEEPDISGSPVEQEDATAPSSSFVDDGPAGSNPDGTESTQPKQNEAAPAISQEDASAATETFCTLSVRCDTILENIDRLKPEKLSIIPENGVIFAEQIIEFTEGENAFDLTLRVMRENNIHLEFVKATMYNSAYIEGIANIYEKDCGSGSGWIYKVNGKSPGEGCSSYILKDGDRVEWVYTCNLGKDL